MFCFPYAALSYIGEASLKSTLSTLTCSLGDFFTPNPFQDTNTVDVTPVASTQLLQDARHLDRDRRAKENIEVDKPLYWGPIFTTCF